MKIGIDCRFWNQTGVGRYTRNLVLNLDKIDNSNTYILFVKSEDENEIKSKIKNEKISTVKADIPWHGILEQVRFPKLINSQNVDLMHFPYFSVPLFYNKPYIVTVHDLIINSYKTGRASTLPYPVYLTKRVGYGVVLSNALKKSKKIIVPSVSVKDNIKTTYQKISPQKIEVIYEGGFDEKKKIGSIKSAIDGGYFLRVGNFYPHKNVENLLLAFKDFCREVDDVKLVLVGKKDYFFSRIAQDTDKLGIIDKTLFIENPKDDELISLYSNSLATVIPSFMEGFSLTGVEALSLGSPVLASDIPTHREILGDSAYYCNPKDPHDIKHKLNKIYELGSVDRKKIVNRGLKQAEKYSWGKMAQETLDIYKTCA